MSYLKNYCSVLYSTHTMDGMKQCKCGKNVFTSRKYVATETNEISVTEGTFLEIPLKNMK